MAGLGCAQLPRLDVAGAGLGLSFFGFFFSRL